MKGFTEKRYRTKNNKYKVSFTTKFKHMAHTLDPSCQGENTSGWTVNAEIHEDYYAWINVFEAQHPKFGTVKGDFETIVTADSKEAYEDFIKNHPPQIWDYWDI